MPKTEAEDQLELNLDQILQTIAEFAQDKTRGINQRKVEYANRLAQHRVGHLLVIKLSIQLAITKARVLAFYLILLGVITHSLPWVPRRIVATIFLGLGAVILLNTCRKMSWLHIVKLALAQK